jgi:hypothetical protein
MTKAPRPKLKTINDRLYLETSRELDLPLKLVKDILINGQGKFTAHVMANNTFDGIRWPYFGVFKAKHKVIQILNYMKGLDKDQKQFFLDMRRLAKKQRKELKKKVL